jgi:hypothetical protein
VPRGQRYRAEVNNAKVAMMGVYGMLAVGLAMFATLDRVVFTAPVEHNGRDGRRCGQSRLVRTNERLVEGVRLAVRERPESTAKNARSRNPLSTRETRFRS